MASAATTSVLMAFPPSATPYLAGGLRGHWTCYLRPVRIGPRPNSAGDARGEELQTGTVTRRRSIVCALVVAAFAPAARAWIYPEHRDIALASIAKLAPAD